jgi:lipopolysaccharide export LptBFGC system permease protein LptF
MPITVLIGTIFVMARLAQSSEFTILRTSGLGPFKALRLLLELGLVFVAFTFVVGDYVTPELIGGGKVPMIANVIESQLLKQRDQALGSALSVTVMMIVALVSIVFLFFNRKFLGGQK